MKKILALMLVILLAVGTPLGINTINVQAASTNISIDVNQSLHKINPNIFGVNHRTGNSGYRTWDRSFDGELYEPVVEASKYLGFPNVRYPGGTITNTIRWEDSIGDWKTRNPFVSPFGVYQPYSSSYGIPEHMKFIKAVNENGTAPIVISPLMNNEDDAADFVEYMNAPNDGSNINGGIDWAAVRAADGHEEPYNIKYWELGNEQYGSWSYRWTSSSEKFAEGGEVTYQPGANKYGYAVKYYDWSKHQSDGEPNQIWYTVMNPIKDGSETIKVGGVVWERVDSLQDVGQGNYYEFDYEEGKITFGDDPHGNIPTQGNTIEVGYTVVKPGANKLAVAMKAVDPTIKVASPWGGDYLSDDVDVYIEHDYTSVNQNLTGHTFYYDIINKADLNYTTLHGKEVILTEWGILAQYKEGPAEYEGHFYKSMTTALFNSKSLMDLVSGGSINYAQRHMLNTSASDDTANTSYKPDVGLIAPVEEGVYVNATALPFKLFTERLSENYVSTSVNNSPVVSNLELIDAVASTNDEKDIVDIIINNYDPQNEQTVTIDLSNFTPHSQGEVWTVDGDSIYDYNDSVNYDSVVIEGSFLDNASSSFSFAAPAHSITAIRLYSADNSLPTLELPEEAPKPVVSFIDTYDNDTIGVKPPSFDVVVGVNAEVLVDASGTDDRSVILKDSGSSKAIAKRRMSPLYGDSKIEYRLLSTDASKVLNIKMGDINETAGMELQISNNMLQYKNTQDIWGDLAPIADDTWYDVLVDFNLKTSNYSVELDGVPLLTDGQILNNTNMLSFVQLSTDENDSNYQVKLSRLDVTCEDTNERPEIVVTDEGQLIKHKSTYKYLKSQGNGITLSDFDENDLALLWECSSADSDGWLFIDSVDNSFSQERLHASQAQGWDVNLVSSQWSGSNVQWDIEEDANGWVRLKHKSSDKWLSYINGNFVLVDSSQLDDNAFWKFEDRQSNSKLHLLQHFNNQYLIVDGTSNLALSNELTEEAIWELDYIIDMFLFIRNTNQTLVNNTLHASAVQNWNVNLTSDNWTGDNVQWEVVQMDDEWYRIKHKASGYWLSYDGSNISLDSNNTISDNQKWRLILQN